MQLALEGVRVIDLTEALAGPYSTMILGDLGADVIKIERPGSGDQSRKWGPPFIGTESAYFLSINRNKRSVEIDIKSTEGRAQMRRLLEQADVFVCNVPRVNSLREVGLDPETVRAYNPRLIYCSITAYGRNGPHPGRGGYDLVAQGEAGLMAATGEVDGEPMRWPVAIADLSSGLWSATAILSSLYVREKTGLGQYIDQSLLDGQLSWSSVMASQYFASGRRPSRQGNRHANIVPYQAFKARDKYMIVAVGTEGQWKRFCETLKLEDSIGTDPRFATNADRLVNRDALSALLASVFVQQEADYWLEKLLKADIPSGPVNAIDEALNDPQVQNRGMIVDFEHPMGEVKQLGNPLHLSETPVTYRRRPPLLGEHTEEVLREAAANLRPVVAMPQTAEPVSSFERPPRQAMELELIIEHQGRALPAVTKNVSDGGCAVHWTGQLPHVHDEVMLKRERNLSRAVARAVVCWSQSRGALGHLVGLQVLREEEERAWYVPFADDVQSGARSDASV